MLLHKPSLESKFIPRKKTDDNTNHLSKNEFRNVPSQAQSVQQSGIEHSTVQSTTRVLSGLGRRPQISLGTDPVNKFPLNPSKPILDMFPISLGIVPSKLLLSI
mmetsp:Transcript_9182/g.18437  ORF Transcript_9182/g.18437 Transcript_9182/m.18437 type:complete len:104 (+) Transcript_9182:1620-1931(+)